MDESGGLLERLSGLPGQRRLARLAFDGNTMGLGAFDVWADALEDGAADRFGLGYNSECWAESRADAAALVREAKAAEAQGVSVLRELVVAV